MTNLCMKLILCVLMSAVFNLSMKCTRVGGRAMSKWLSKK